MRTWWAGGWTARRERFQGDSLEGRRHQCSYRLGRLGCVHTHVALVGPASSLAGWLQRGDAILALEPLLVRLAAENGTVENAAIPLEAAERMRGAAFATAAHDACGAGSGHCTRLRGPLRDPLDLSARVGLPSRGQPGGPPPPLLRPAGAWWGAFIRTRPWWAQPRPWLAGRGGVARSHCLPPALCTDCGVSGSRGRLGLVAYGSPDVAPQCFAVVDHHISMSVTHGSFGAADAVAAMCAGALAATAVVLRQPQRWRGRGRGNGCSCSCTWSPPCATVSAR